MGSGKLLYLAPIYMMISNAVFEANLPSSQFVSTIDLLPCQDGYSPLICAAAKGRYDMTKLLITKKANVNFISEVRANFCTTVTNIGATSHAPTAVQNRSKLTRTVQPL